MRVEWREQRFNRSTDAVEMDLRITGPMPSFDVEDYVMDLGDKIGLTLHVYDGTGSAQSMQVRVPKALLQKLVSDPVLAALSR